MYIDLELRPLELIAIMSNISAREHCYNLRDKRGNCNNAVIAKAKLLRLMEKLPLGTICGRILCLLAKSFTLTWSCQTFI